MISTEKDIKMTKRIYGGWDITHNLNALGKRTVQGINDEVFDANGNLDIDTYTKQEMLDIVGLLPLSHYGTHNYLPAGVSGSFDGASENQNYRRAKIFLEDDGTVVILRAGTNGSTEGLYYSYLQNGLEVTDLGIAVNTNKPYMPGYFGINMYAVGLIASDDNIAVGYYKNSTNASSGMFLSIMNGTLNDQQHSGFFINSADVAPEGTLTYAMQANDGSFYFFSTSTPSNRLEICVVRLDYNSAAGTYTTTRITGWSSKLFYNTTETGTNNIVLMQSMISTNVADKPFALYPAEAYDRNLYMTSIDLYVGQDASGLFRLRINGDAWFASPLNSTRPQHGFSCTINMGTKQSTLDAGNDISTTQAPLVVAANFAVSGSVLNSDPLYDHSGYRNIFSTYNYLSTGYVFSISTPNLSQALLIQRSKFPESSVFQQLNVRSSISGSYSAGVLKSTFGSAVGSWIAGLELLPDNSTKQFTNSSTIVRPSYAVHKSTPDFTFQSLTYGTVKGYEPTSERAFTTNNYDMMGLISSVSGSTVTTNGGIFVTDLRYSQSFSFDKQCVGTGSISITPSVLDALKASEYAKVPASWNLSSTATKAFILYVPQQTNIPAFAMLSTTTTDGKNYVKMIEVNVNTRTGNITSASFKRDLYEVATSGNFVVNSGAYFASATVGINIYDAGSFYFVGGSNPLFHSTVGNSNTPYFRGIVDKASGQFTDMRPSGYHPSYDTENQPGSVPGIGFGVFNKMDQANKMVFQKIGTTIAEYNAWAVTGEPIVMVSQDVAQGFIVYFTEETPVMLSGKSFTLPITNIDLRTVKANPANSTFYIYVKMNQGVAEYNITSEVISETGTTAYNVFWIGKVTTDSLQISEIEVFKRSRLDVFGASLEASGSSFPVSYGLPTNNGTINW